MGGKAQVSAKASAENMPSGSGALGTPEKAQCHPGEIIKIDVSPATLDFGKVRAGGKVQATITIKNVGKTVLTLQAIAIDPNPETSWAAPQPQQATLKRSQSVTVSVTLHARKTGECKGKIEVKSDATEGNKEVELKAKVFAINDPSPEKFLAPGADNEDYKVLYTVDDPAGAVDEGELQILDKDKKEVWKRALTEDERKHGKHEIPWKGQITAKTGYPDGYLTVEFSPYTSRVVLKAKGATEPAQVDSVLKVEPHSLKIALGEKAHLKQDQDKAVFDQVTTDGGVPAEGQKRKVYLPSNRFSTKQDDDHHDDNSSFKEHKNLWGGGAALPLEATVWLKTSAAGVAENKTLAPLGLGNARVLWDFADVPEDTSGLTSLPKTFVDNALAWNKASTEPPGDNCADVRGGKRADNGSTKPVLLIPSGHNDGDRSAANQLTEPYPYAAARGTTRRWAVLAEVLKTGANKGKCGIIFQGSRMAGDAFTVHAYLDVNRELDRNGDLPEFIKNNQPEKHPSAKTGTLEIWKEVHIVKVFSKNGNNIHTHSEVTPHYEKAYVRLVDKTGGITAFVEADYNTLYKAAITATTPDSKALLLKPHAIDDADHQFGGTSGLRVVSRTAFENNYMDFASTPTKVDAEVDGHYDPVTMTNTKYPQPVRADQQAAARTNLRNDALNELIAGDYTDSNPVDGDKKYWAKCDPFGADVTQAFCNSYMDATHAPDDGISIFVFAQTNNSWKAGYDGKRGRALWPEDPPRVTVKRSGYMQFGTHAVYSAKYPDGSHSMTRTVCHEIGHLLFLPHTRDEGVAKDDKAHDYIDRTCIMGYNFTSPRHFCGYCLLRLRGWDHTHLKCGTEADPRQNGSEPKLEVSAPQDQSSTKVNKTADQIFSIKNTGPGPLVMGTIVLEGPDKDQYEIKPGNDKASGETISTGGTKILKLTFKPTSGGDKTVSLRIPSNDSASPRVLTFTSKAEQPALDVAPASLDFGTVLRGATSAEQTLTLKNTGAPELTIDKIELTGTYPGDFSITSPAGSTKLAKDATTTVKLKFKGETTKPADADWEKDAKLRIVSNAAASPKDVALKGMVIWPRLVIGTPAAIPQTWVGKESVQTIKYKSVTSDHLNLKGITLEGADKAHFELRNLPANGIQTKGTLMSFKVAYKPTAAGSHSAQVKVDSNADGNPHMLNFSGTAVNPPKLVMAASQAFPATTAGAQSNQSITIQNTGGAELSITGVAGATAEFVLGGTGSMKIAAGGSGTLNVTFKPGSAGAKTATLTVTSNDPATPSATITLTGTGT